MESKESIRDQLKIACAEELAKRQQAFAKLDEATEMLRSARQSIFDKTHKTIMESPKIARTRIWARYHRGLGKIEAVGFVLEDLARGQSIGNEQPYYKEHSLDECETDPDLAKFVTEFFYSLL